MGATPGLAGEVGEVGCVGCGAGWIAGLAAAGGAAAGAPAGRSGTPGAGPVAGAPAGRAAGGAVAGRTAGATAVGAPGAAAAGRTGTAPGAVGAAGLAAGAPAGAGAAASFGAVFALAAAVFAASAAASAAARPRKCLRASSACSISMELECVFFSVTPIVGKKSIRTFALISSSRASSFNRTCLESDIRLFQNCSVTRCLPSFPRSHRPSPRRRDPLRWFLHPRAILPRSPEVPERRRRRKPVRLR